MAITTKNMKQDRKFILQGDYGKLFGFQDTLEKAKSEASELAKKKKTRVVIAEEIGYFDSKSPMIFKKRK